MSIVWIIILFVYFLINFLLSIWIYNQLKPFYTPKFVKDDCGNSINLHEKYHVFKKNDKLSFFRILLGTNLLLWWRFFLAFIACALCSFSLRLLNYVKKNDSKKLVNKIIKFYSSIVVFCFGGRFIIKKVDCKEVYQKYFGKDYDFQDQNYSLVISNHTGWADSISYLNYLQCGFIAKYEVQIIPIIGIIAKQVGGMFVNREDAENRHLILDKIEERQRQFMKNRVDNNPLMVFVEGTVTSGEHMLKFKKGAFHSLLPLKPSIIQTNNNKFHLSNGSAGLLPQFLLTLCYFYNNLEFTELPVMRPNEFMFVNYTKAHPEIKEKWEIYAEVAREIMCSISGMKKSEMTLRDSYDYANTINGVKRTMNKTE